MGLDGGTIISRTDVLRGASWEVANSDSSRSTRGGQVSTSYTRRREAADARAAADGVWRACSLSGEPLQEGETVACALGRLYNRQACLEYLLAQRGTFAEDRVAYQLANRLASGSVDQFSHLRSMKDVFPVLLTPARQEAEGASGADAAEPRCAWECAVSGARAGRGGVPFCALRPCGHVVAARVLANVPDKVCGVCSAPYVSAVALNIGAEEEARLRAALGTRKRRRERTADS